MGVGDWGMRYIYSFSHFFDVSISPVFLSNTLGSYLPFGILTIFCAVLFYLLFVFGFLGGFFFGFGFLYFNLYLLFRLLLNLSVISKRKKINKKTPSVLKYCIAIVFNAKYYL